MISEYMGSSANAKTVKQCEEHYWENFMGRFGRCLPIPHDLITEDQIASYLETKGIAAQEINIAITEGHDRDELVVRDKGKERMLKDKAELRERQAQLPGADLPGFMPLREDFDVEYENDAENLLADMEFSPDDHPSERELKMQIIRIYNLKLAERDRRKRFVIDRGLVDFKKQQSIEKRRTKEERELVSRLRMFARFHSAADHEALVEGLLKAKKLRKQIELLQHYRAMGIKTIEGARQYEVERKRRDADQKNQKMRDVTPYLFETGRSTLASVNNNKSNSRSSRGGRTDKDDVNAVGEMSSSSSNIFQCSATSDNGTSVLQLADIARAPGADHLSDKELDLCEKVPFLPMHYLAAKDAIVRELYRNGDLTLQGIRRVINVSFALLFSIQAFISNCFNQPL